MNRERLHHVIDLLLDMRGALLPQAPKEAMAHFRNARRESLLGVKVLVEHALERLEQEEQRQEGAEGSKPIPLE
ncbi:MAG: hypothetical protein ACOY93_08200 [Bacillota bacterium]